MAKALSENGYGVTITCQNKNQNEEHEVIDNIIVSRLPRTHLLPLFMQKLVNFPVWFNPVWIYSIYKNSRNLEGGIIVVRDLPLVYSGIIVAKLVKAKLIFDMAECYPEMYASSQQFSKSSFLERLLKNPKLAARYEKSSLKNVDQTLVMIEESKTRAAKIGAPVDRVTIVSNTPSLNKFQGILHQHSGTSLKIVYVGFLTKLRGLDILIRAVSEFIKNGHSSDDIQVDIVGTGSEKNNLIELCEQLNVTSSVKIHGWLDQSHVDKLMQESNVGALTYRVCGHWNNTIPNKIFDYMLAGIPVLATPVIPIERIINETGCGIVCKDQDPVDIALKLAQLRDFKVRDDLGQKGYQAILEKYNWQNDMERLIRAVQ
ncbi:MAG: glycosyltransferase family 4 protein [Marinobacter sp.]|uniref:glycosyltransferase family 4 protein n=1 Tax=Marinobacter sp. TaxID=50741 RepID=UPI00396DA373